MPSFSKKLRRPGCHTAGMASIRCRYNDARVGLFEVNSAFLEPKTESDIASAAVLVPDFCSDNLRRMLRFSSAGD